MHHKALRGVHTALQPDYCKKKFFFFLSIKYFCLFFTGFCWLLYYITSREKIQSFSFYCTSQKHVPSTQYWANLLGMNFFVIADYFMNSALLRHYKNMLQAFWETYVCTSVNVSVRFHRSKCGSQKNWQILQGTLKICQPISLYTVTANYSWNYWGIFRNQRDVTPNIGFG